MPAWYFAVEKPLPSVRSIPYLSGGWIYASEWPQRLTLPPCFQKVSNSNVGWVIDCSDRIFVVTVGIRSWPLLYILFNYHPASRRCSPVVELLTASLNKQHVDSKRVAYVNVFKYGSQNANRPSNSVIVSWDIYNSCCVCTLQLMMAELSFLKAGCCCLLFL
jgi:hypothetical protein